MINILKYLLFFFHEEYELWHSIEIDKYHQYLKYRLTSSLQESFITHQWDLIKDLMNISSKMILHLSLIRELNYF